MKKRMALMGVSLFFVMVFTVTPSMSSQDQQALWQKSNGQGKTAISAEYIPGEVLVKFKDGVRDADIMSLNTTLHAQEVRTIAPLGVKRMKLSSIISVEEAVFYYNSDPNVDYAEPNYIVDFMAMPNDPDFDELWGLHNTGQPVDGQSGTPDADIDAPEAWDITTGSDSVIIAVLDSGVAYDHPELSPNIWVNSAEIDNNGVDDDGNGYIDDVNGWDFWANDNDPQDYNSHGTHVSGTIAARGNNGSAITGENWNAKIMAVRVGGAIGSIGDATEAIAYAVDNGAVIINASWGGGAFSQTLYDAISYANTHGVLFIAAAGNGGSDGVGDDNDATPQYPSSYDLPNVIAVAATDQDDSITSFSNYGLVSVDVAAPGDNIYSSVPIIEPSGATTILYSEDFGPPNPSGWTFSGTNNTWGFGSGTGVTGDCLEDSPGGNYLNNTESLAAYGNAFPGVKDNFYGLYLDVKYDLESDWDFLVLVCSPDGSDWYVVDYRTGSTDGGFISDAFDLTVIGEFFTSFYFGFVLDSDSIVTFDGVYLDDLKLTRTPMTISSYDYDYYPGTSMATPHVSGLAGLIKAQNPNYSHLQIRDAIFHSVDAILSLADKVVTGGRINAFKAVTYMAPPQNFSRTAGDGAVTLQWSANNESTITGYIISYGTTAALGTDVAVGNMLTHTVSGLTNGTTYHFAVRAVGSFPVAGTLESVNSNILTATPTEGGSSSSGGGGGGCFIATLNNN